MPRRLSSIVSRSSSRSDNIDGPAFFRNKGGRIVILLTGRQTKDAYRRFASNVSVVCVMASTPPYNTRPAEESKTDEEWSNVIEYSSNAPVFGIPMQLAIERLFKHPKVVAMCREIGVAPVQHSFSSFVVGKYEKIDLLVDPHMSEEKAAPWQRNLLRMRSFFQAIHNVLTAEESGASSVAPELVDLQNQMRSLGSMEEWMSFVRRHCGLPEDFVSRLHVTEDSDMILSMFGCPPELFGPMLDDPEQRRALQWVSKLVSVGWGIEGCLGDVFNTVYVLMQRAMKLSPEKFTAEDEIFLSPPSPSKESSAVLSRVVDRFLYHVENESGISVLREGETFVHVHDFEGDDDKARVVYHLLGVESAKEIVQIPHVNLEAGWTSKHQEEMRRLVMEREKSSGVECYAYVDPECDNGKVLRSIVRVD